VLSANLRRVLAAGLHLPFSGYSSHSCATPPNFSLPHLSPLFILQRISLCHLSSTDTMAAVYKALSNGTSTKQSSSQNAHKEFRQRLLMLTSRGVTFRHRHLLTDLQSLLPHARKESKLDTKTKLYQLNELAELYNCNNVLYFEARKGKDLYAWISKPPNGPTIKFHIQNCKLPRATGLSKVLTSRSAHNG
jgi:Brix domain-containing protein